MLPRRLQDITLDDVKALIENAVHEGRTIDYKLTLPGNSDEEKKEFLADIISFANSAGGDLVYGIRERVDEKGKNTGLPETLEGVVAPNHDAIRLRLDSIIRDGIEPRIQGVDYRFVDSGAGKFVVVMRVPRSWAAPHQRTFKASSLFFSRNSAGKYGLDVTELRNAFLQGASVNDRLEQRRLERLGKVEDQLPSPSHVVLHAFPLSMASDSSPPAVNLQWLYDNYDQFFPRGGGEMGWGRRYNFDGVQAYGSSDGKRISYTQFFRTGYVELASSGPFYEDSAGKRYFEADRFGRITLTNLTRIMRLFDQLGIAGPYLVGISVIGAANTNLVSGAAPQRVLSDLGPRVFDRNALIAPGILLLDSNAPLDAAARPALDAIWQAAGFSKCHHFSDDGSLREEWSSLYNA